MLRTVIPVNSATSYLEVTLLNAAVLAVRQLIEMIVLIKICIESGPFIHKGPPDQSMQVSGHKFAYAADCPGR